MRRASARFTLPACRWGTSFLSVNTSTAGRRYTAQWRSEWAGAKHCNNGPPPRPPVPDAVYRLHPWRRVLLPRGEGTQDLSRCELFSILLGEADLPEPQAPAEGIESPARWTCCLGRQIQGLGCFENTRHLGTEVLHQRVGIHIGA